MRLERYTEEHKNQWNDFVRQADNGHFMFLRHYMDYHSDRFEDHSLLIFDENKLRAILPANVKDHVMHSHQGLTFGGFILNAKSYTADVLEILAELKRYMAAQGMQALIYKCIPAVFHKVSRLEDRYALWQSGAELFRRDISSVIDLRAERKYRSTKKQNIKKGLQAGLEIVELESLTEFWDLLIAVLKARHAADPTHSLAEIQALKEALPKNIKAKGVVQNGHLLGGAVLFLNNKSVHTQYLGVNDQGRALGALDYLLDHEIQSFSAAGYHHFSFGISTEAQGKTLNEGLIFQKEGFGARAVMHDFYRLNA